MTNRSISLTDSLYEYLLAVSLREPELLRRLRDETASCPDARMQIAPEQGQFMALLVRLMGARRCLEVGVFTGYSSLAVALALPDDRLRRERGVDLGGAPLLGRRRRRAQD